MSQDGVDICIEQISPSARQDESAVSSGKTASKKRQRKKTGIELSIQSCHRLIALVEEKPNLWDVRSPTYKDRVMREVAWEQIALDLGVEKEVASVKWGLLRQQFRVSYII